MKQEPKIGQSIRHFLYGCGTVNDITKNSAGETCYDIYFPNLNKVVTVMDKGALEPMVVTKKDREEMQKIISAWAENVDHEKVDKVLGSVLNSVSAAASGKDKTVTRKPNYDEADAIPQEKGAKISVKKVEHTDPAASKIIGDGNIPEEVMPVFGKIRKPFDNVKHHREIVLGLNELYAKKNADYGNSFHETYLEEGMAMARIRLSDKLSRFKSLTKSGQQRVKDESVRDTLLDLANYAIMTVIEIDREIDEAKAEEEFWKQQQAL